MSLSNHVIRKSKSSSNRFGIAKPFISRTQYVVADFDSNSSSHARKSLQNLLLCVGLLLAACGLVKAQTVVATVPTGTYPSAVAVNTNTNMVYVANNVTNNVTVIDGATNTPTTLTAGPAPIALAVNLNTNTIYVVNVGVASGPEVVTPGNILVINGATNATSTIPLPLLGRGIVVNPVTNLIYVGTSDGNNNNNLMVIDGATTNTVATIPLPQAPAILAINTKTNTIYVDCNSGGNGSDQGEISVIDGATNTITTNIGMNRATQPMAVNETTNTLYAINTSSIPNGFNLLVIDGATNAITATVPWPNQPQSVAVNPVTNKVYVGTYNQSNGASTVMVLDGATNTITATVNADSSLQGQLLVNTVTNTIYETSSPVMVLDGATNTATSIAVGSGAQFGALNAVTNYVYVANYFDKTVSVINAAANGPAFNPSPSPLAFGNQTEGSTSAAKTLTVTNSGTTNLTITTVTPGGTNMADFIIGTDTCANATVSSGKTCTVSIEFAPSTTAAESATLAFADNAPATPQTVMLTGTGAAPVPTATTTALSASSTSVAIGKSITFTATVSPASGTPTPTGTVTFKDGATTLGTGTLNSGVATYTAAAFAEGAHSVTASYGGDSRNLASISAAVPVTATAASSTTALTSSAASAVVGASITFTATVTGASGAQAPTGTVTFKDGTTTLGTGALNASGVATYATSALAAGSHSVTANYGGDANNAASASPSVTVAVWPGPPDFTLALSPASGSFKAGTPATIVITVTSVNGFNAATTLTCGTLPKNTTCSFSSGSITPDVSGTATSTLTVTTDKKPTAAISQIPRGDQAPLRHPLIPAGTELAFVLVPLIGARNRKLRRMLLTLTCFGILAILISTGISGCGGGPTTPKGNYPIAVTATAGSATHTATFSLTVQ